MSDVTLPLLNLNTDLERVKYVESILDSYTVDMLTREEEAFMIKYAAEIALRTGIKPKFMKGCDEAFELLKLPRRKACLTLFISPSSPQEMLYDYISELAVYGIEHFIHNNPTGISSKVRRQKIENLKVHQI
jgi:hypothetical protein